MGIDLIFTAFSKKFNPHKIVKGMPLLTSLGLAVYAIAPQLLPSSYAFWGLLAGTILFSVSAGLSEVLLSPMIAAIPSETPDRDMSRLHSLYAFGVFTVVVVSTLFLRLFGQENWMYLTLFLALWPIVAAVLFAVSPMPDMTAHGGDAAHGQGNRHRIGILLCVLCIFFGACAENGMSNWISGYVEAALQVDKALGDILGMALFAILLGLTRIWYAKYGKHIGRVLLVGMIGATACYLAAAFSTGAVPAFIACVCTGIFTSMLWPGTLILMEENVHGAGVAAFALMAAGGDMGASVTPQLMGVVVDRVAALPVAAQWGLSLGITPEQVGMKAAMLVAALFPLLGTAVVLVILRYFRNKA